MSGRSTLHRKTLPERKRRISGSNIFLTTVGTMCRSIKVLRSAEAPPTPEDVRAAALQYVRKISGYRKPSQANAEAFDLAVDEITEASEKLLESLVFARRAA